MRSAYLTDPARPDLGGNLPYGDPCTWCPTLWRHLVDRFGIDSVLDVGCGEGHAVKFFRRLGVVAMGLDGLRQNVLAAVTPILLHDLTGGPFVSTPVDLVWSCEVAEHISPDFVDHYLDTLANGKIVAMTHAVPGQDGHHHVNCQHEGYWIERMAQRGYALSGENEALRRLSLETFQEWNHFQRTGLVFTRAPASSCT